jgi:hypothetical protein
VDPDDEDEEALMAAVAEEEVRAARDKKREMAADGLIIWKELWTPHRSQASKMLQLR